MDLESSNRLIAEFMLPHSAFLTEESGFPAKKLEYHSSYDWLMPVLEKIQSLNYVYEICNGACRIKIPTDRGWWLEETTIKSVFSAVVEFIKWYNSNEKN